MLSTVRSAEGGEGDMTLSKRNETHLASPRVFGGGQTSSFGIFGDDLPGCTIRQWIVQL